MEIAVPSDDEDDGGYQDLPGLFRRSISPSEPTGQTIGGRSYRSPYSSSARAAASPRRADALGDPARAAAERRAPSAALQRVQPASVRAEHWRSVESILTSIEQDSSVLVGRLASELNGDAMGRALDELPRMPALGEKEQQGGERRSPARPQSPASPGVGPPPSAAPPSPSPVRRGKSAIADVNSVLSALDREWSAAWEDFGASAAGRYGAMSARMAELEAELVSLRRLAAHGAWIREGVANAGPRRAGRLSTARVLAAWRSEAARVATARAHAEVRARSAVARHLRRLEWRVFGAWRGAAEATRSAMGVARRWGSRALRVACARCFASWVARRESRAQAVRRLGYAIRLFLHRKVGAAVRTWVASAQAHARFARKGAALVSSLRNGGLGRAFRSWGANLRARARRRGLKRNVIGRLRNRRAARALGAWLANVGTRARNARLLAKFSARLVHRHAWAVFLPWARHVAARSAARRAAAQLGERAVQRMARQLEGRAFASLSAHVARARRLRLVALRAVAKWRFRLLIAILRAWQGRVAARGAQLARLRALWLRTALRLHSVCLGAWRRFVLLRAEQRVALYHMAARRLTHNLGAALRGWHAAVLSAQYGRRRWVALLWRIVVSWRAYGHQRREARLQRAFHSELLHSGTRALLVGRGAALAPGGSPRGARGSLDAQLRRERAFASPPRIANGDLASVLELFLSSAREGEYGEGARESGGAQSLRRSGSGAGPARSRARGPTPVALPGSNDDEAPHGREAAAAAAARAPSTGRSAQSAGSSYSNRTRPGYTPPEFAAPAARQRSTPTTAHSALRVESGPRPAFAGSGRYAARAGGAASESEEEEEEARAETPQPRVASRSSSWARGAGAAAGRRSRSDESSLRSLSPSDTDDDRDVADLLRR